MPHKMKGGDVASLKKSVSQGAASLKESATDAIAHAVHANDKMKVSNQTDLDNNINNMKCKIHITCSDGKNLYNQIKDFKLNKADVPYVSLNNLVKNLGENKIKAESGDKVALDKYLADLRTAKKSINDLFSDYEKKSLELLELKQINCTIFSYDVKKKEMSNSQGNIIKFRGVDFGKSYVVVKLPNNKTINVVLSEVCVSDDKTGIERKLCDLLQKEAAQKGGNRKSSNANAETTTTDYSLCE